MNRTVHAEPTPEELEAVLSHPDASFEIVDGEIVEKSNVSIRAQWIALGLFRHIDEFVRANRLGWAGHELKFLLDPARPLSRQPDVSFVSYERWPAGKRWADEGDWPVVPDLAIEILSPHDRGGKVSKKVREYFRYGVRQVWLIQPETSEVSIYTAPKRVQILDEEDAIEGGDVLPGLRLAVADLFKDEA